MDDQESSLIEEKEDGELEEGELEEDEVEEPSPSKSSQGDMGTADKRTSESDAHMQLESDAREDGKKERRESRESKEEKKRKHRDDDEEKRKKKKKKKKHANSEGEDDDGTSPKLHQHKMIVPTFDKNMEFDAMLQQEMLLRGRSPPPGMIPYGPPPGAFGGPPHPMFRGRPVSDYDSYESGSDSEMRERQARRPRRPNRRFRRSRSRSRSPSRKNEAICMYYMQGSCQRGKGCPYSHDIQPQRKMELCKFYMMDCCAKKDKCLYMHKDFPCKHYHTGVKCKSADKCKFSHDPLSDASRSVLLKHIELAPKDILGDFPRLTKDAAQLVVAITEAHRKGNPMDVETIPGIMDFKGRGFKYVDKAIKNVLKKQEARMKNMPKDQPYMEDMGDRRSPEHPHHHPHSHPHSHPLSHPHQHPHPHSHGHQHHQHQHSHPHQHPHSHPHPHPHPHAHPQQQQQQQQHGEGGMTPPRHTFTPPLSEERESSESPQKNPGSSNNTASNVSNMNSGQGASTSNRKSFMTARMPQKQRELFQRIEQQHSVQHEQEDTATESALDDTPLNPNNVNWYSSDEDGEAPCSTKMQGQGMSLHTGGNSSPSRTPPLPSMSGSSGSFPTTEKQGSSPGSSSTSQKGAFAGINLDNINISSDLASVLSALKNHNASSNNRNNSEDFGKDQRMLSPRGKDPRDLSRDSREASKSFRDAGLDQDLSKISREGNKAMGDMYRDPRDVIQSPRESTDYSPWQRDQMPLSGLQDPWDHPKMDSSKDQDQQRNFLDIREGSDMDHDQRLRKRMLI